MNNPPDRHSDPVVPANAHSHAYVHGLFLAALFGAMAFWTWGTWADPVIDFGREVYVPWRLSAGDVLYRDIAYFQGPLSAYIHAALFKVFGVHLLTLTLFNLLLTAATSAMLWFTARRIANAYAATSAVTVFICCFAFSRLLRPGNYNFVCAYSYEVPHGVFLAVAALAALDRALETGRQRWFVIAGFCCGLLALTKMEIALAGLAAVGAKLIVAVMHRGWRESAGDLFSGVIAAVAPGAIALVLLASAMPLREAAVGVAGSWAYVFDRTLVGNPFFKALMGTDHLGENLWKMALIFATGAGALGAVVAKARVIKPTKWVALVAAAIAAATFYGLGVPFNRIDWQEPPRAFTPAAALLVGVWLFRVVRSRRDEREWRADACGLAFAVFATCMLLRMLFIPKIEHYGFALTAPVTFLLTVAIVGRLPAWVDRRGGSGVIVRMPATALVVVFCQYCLATQTQILTTLKWTTGTGQDRFHTDERGLHIQRAADYLQGVARPGDTLLVLPEGIMLNYLTRLPSPTRHLNFIPTSLLMFGEEKMLADLRAKPADWVTVVRYDVSEYGSGAFGEGFGQKIARWIAEQYEPVAEFHPDLDPPPFSVQVYRRRGAMAR